MDGLVDGLCAHFNPYSFVSRVNPKDTSHHAILGTHEFRPTDFAAQINLNMDNAWGILRCVIDYFMKCEPGTYLMLKDPNKVGDVTTLLIKHDLSFKLF